MTPASPFTPAHAPALSFPDRLQAFLADRSPAQETAYNEACDKMINRAILDAQAAGEVPLPETAPDAATCGAGSDCYPYTVVKTSKSGAKITLRRDLYRLTNPDLKVDYGFNPEYSYFSDPAGETVEAHRRKNGKYYLHGSPVYIGRRRYYQDPSF